MPSSKLPLNRMKVRRHPYLIDNGDFSGSFAFRVTTDAPGAVPDLHPDHGGDFLVAFSPRCTHMGCLLLRDEDDRDPHDPRDNGSEQLLCGPCACHGTTFDLLKGGLVVLGPATQNLAQLKLEVDGNEVKATGWRAHVHPVEEHWPP